MYITVNIHTVTYTLLAHMSHFGFILLFHLRMDWSVVSLRSYYHCRFSSSTIVVMWLSAQSTRDNATSHPVNLSNTHEDQGYFRINVALVKIRNNRRSPRSLKRTSGSFPAFTFPRHLFEWLTFKDRSKYIPNSY